MGKPRNVTLGGLEFSVGGAYETRPTKKWVNSRQDAGDTQPQTGKTEDSKDGRGLQSKPSR